MIRRFLGVPFRGFATALAFLTRLPISNGPTRESDLGRAVSFFPLVGLVLGLVMRGLVHVSGGHLSPFLEAALLLALLALLTGGLHLDGLSDVVDALGGARGDRDRMLAIMRDSRIGAHGASALVLHLMAKTSALAGLLERHDLSMLLAFPMIARWTVVPLIVLFPYARPDGLGRSFHQQAQGRDLIVATAMAAGVIVVLGPRVALAAVVALAVALSLGLWMRARLGGLTGDIYGTAVELSELAVLVVANVWH